MKLEKKSAASRLENLVSSLELVSARMIETSLINSQLASSQTPEMRGLFNKWLGFMSDEIERFFEGNADVNLTALSEATGLSRRSALSLLVSLDRMGKIKIRSVRGEKGNGKNSEICGCLNNMKE